VISFRLPDSRGFFIYDIRTDKKIGTSEHITVLNYIITTLTPSNGPYPSALAYALQQVYPDAIIKASVPKKSMRDEENVVY
jgi:hypothetical protein